MPDIGKITGSIEIDGKNYSVSMEKVVDKTDWATKSIEDKFTALGGKVESFGKKLSLFVTVPLTALGLKSIHAFEDQEKAIVRVDSALKATGNAVGFTTDQLVGMSEQFQKVTTFADEDILGNVTAQLLKFGTVHGEVFKRAQQVIVDYASGTGTSLETATQQIGRALEDPIQGLTLLRRAGVVFNKSQQEMVQNMVKVGDTANAQGFILKTFEGKFKGTAEAMANTDSGRIQKAWNTIGDSMEVVGKILLEFMVPIAEKVKQWAIGFQGLAPHIQKIIVGFGAFMAILGPVLVIVGQLISALGNIIKVARIVWAALGPLIEIFEAIGAAIAGGISAPIALAIAAIALLTGAVLLFWPEVKKLGEILFDFGVKIKNWASNVFETIGEKLQFALNVVAEFVNGVRQWLVDHFGGVVEKFQKLANMVMTPVKKIAAFLGERFGMAKDLVVSAVDSMGNKVSDFFGKAPDIVEKAGKKIKKVPLLDGAVENVDKNLLKMKAFLVDFVDKTADKFGDFASSVIRGTKSVSQAFGDMVDSILDDMIKMFASDLFKQLGGALLGALFGGPIGALGGAALGGASAHGNVFSGPVQPFAQGGVIPGPISFPMGGNKVGIAGERGPEAIFPIVRTSNGDLGVRAQNASPGGQGGNPGGPVSQMFAITVNLDSRPILESVQKATQDGRITINARSVK